MNSNSLKAVVLKMRTAILSVRLRNRRTQAILVGIAVLLVAGIYGILSLHSAPVLTAEVALRPVELVDVSAYVRQGEVKTTENGAREVVVRAEVGGKVTQVAAKGARVSLGQIVAELENSSQRAALLQAQGSLDVASAGLSKTRRGSREQQQSILGTNVSSAESSLSTANASAVTSLSSAYAAVEDAIRFKSDDLFDGADTSAPHFSVPTTESQRATQAESLRVTIGAILKRENDKSQSLSVNDDLTGELKRTSVELSSVRAYLDNLIVVVNKAIPTSGTTAAQIATYKSDLSTARGSISTAIASLNSAQDALVSRQASIDVAQQNLNQGTTVDEADILSASASVKQAEGAYASALAAYQKTVIHAPASGTIIACSPAVGDIVNTGSDICRITASGSVSGTSFALPLSAVKYTPGGAYVFTVGDDGTLKMEPVETGLVSADSIAVAGLIGDERIVRDIRGLTEGDKVQVVSQ